jgi:DHA1 family multidrug resistance protein-like MFS transporter
MADHRLSAVTTPVMFGALSFGFLSFILPVYTHELGADAVQIGGLFSVFTLTLLAARPIVGWLLDRFGRRWFFAASLGFYVIAMLVFSRAEGLTDFYVARLVQGVGAALMWVSARTIIADVTVADGAGRAMGRLTQAGARGILLGGFWGFSLLGLLPMAQAWTWAFLGYAVAALTGLVIAVWLGSETRPEHTDASPAMGHVPPLFFRLLPIVLLSNFASALIVPVYLIYLQDRFDVPVLGLATAFLPGVIVMATLPAHAGRLSDRFGRIPLMVFGLLASASVSMLLPTVPSLVWLALMYLLFFTGWALVEPAEAAMVADLAGEHQRGRIYAWYEFSVGIGAATGPLVGGFVYENLGKPMPFYVNAALLLLAASLIWIFLRK